MSNKKMKKFFRSTSVWEDRKYGNPQLSEKSKKLETTESKIIENEGIVSTI